MTIIVHHLENSRSQRILWMLEELGLDYEVVRYARDPKTMLAPSALRAIHPLGKSPLLDEDGVIYAERGAIVEHLVQSNGRLGPAGSADDRRRWTMFLHYAEGSMMPPLLAMLVVRRLGILGRPARKPIQRMFDAHLRYLEHELSTRPWFAGDEFSAADIMMSFPLEAARHRGGLDSRYPNLQQWLDRIHKRPAYGRALEAGGPYAYD